jgi:hypothetical protein
MMVRSARGPGWQVEPTSGLIQVCSSLRRVASDADYTPAAEYETRRVNASRGRPRCLRQLICDTTKVNTGAAETTRTDRDIATVAEEARHLQVLADDELSPPIRHDRERRRLAHLEKILAGHGIQRSREPARCSGGEQEQPL